MGSLQNLLQYSVLPRKAIVFWMKIYKILENLLISYIKRTFPEIMKKVLKQYFQHVFIVYSDEFHKEHLFQIYHMLHNVHFSHNSFPSSFPILDPIYPPFFPQSLFCYYTLLLFHIHIYYLNPKVGKDMKYIFFQGITFLFS